MLTATARAWHLLLNGPRALLQDWMAWPLLGPDAETSLELARGVMGDHTADLATWIAARTRLSEDWLTASKAEQYVILGAGLDTFAWRQGMNSTIRPRRDGSGTAWENLAFLHPRRSP